MIIWIKDTWRIFWYSYHIEVYRYLVRNGINTTKNHHWIKMQKHFINMSLKAQIWVIKNV